MSYPRDRNRALDLASLLATAPWVAGERSFREVELSDSIIAVSRLKNFDNKELPWLDREDKLDLQELLEENRNTELIYFKSESEYLLANSFPIPRSLAILLFASFG
jgi:hypothetical protein